MKSSPKSGFTLIELLIVVAIIAILAAIAVPNFLEAQTRAKVSRMLSDMRSVSTALEAYVVDHNRYPIADTHQLAEEALQRLTTPVSFISSIPLDIFRPPDHLHFLQVNPASNATATATAFPALIDTTFTPSGLTYLSKEDSTSLLARAFASDYLRFQQELAQGVLVPASDVARFPYERGYQLRAFGPDRIDSQAINYDASNGTVSVGDITRWGPTSESTGNN